MPSYEKGKRRERMRAMYVGLRKGKAEERLLERGPWKRGGKTASSSYGIVRSTLSFQAPADLAGKGKKNDLSAKKEKERKRTLTDHERTEKPGKKGHFLAQRPSRILRLIYAQERKKGRTCALKREKYRNLGSPSEKRRGGSAGGDGRSTNAPFLVLSTKEVEDRKRKEKVLIVEREQKKGQRCFVTKKKNIPT